LNRAEAIMKPEKPKREPKQRRPAVTPEEADDSDFEPPDPSIPKPYQLPGLIQPPMHLRITG